METLKLVQKKYHLIDDSGQNFRLEKEPQIFVVMDGILTEIKIEEMFDKYHYGIGSIVGYSVLEYLKLENNFFINSIGVKVSFYDKTSNKNVFVKELSDPFFQLNDRSISIEKRDYYINVLNDSLEKVKKEIQLEKQVEEEIKEPIITEEKIQEEEHTENPVEEEILPTETTETIVTEEKKDIVDDAEFEFEEAKEETKEEIKKPSYQELKKKHLEKLKLKQNE